jgi:hypothetical protein
MARYYTQSDLNQAALKVCTPVQREKLEKYLTAGWRVTKSACLRGYDSIIFICMDRTMAVIEPNGQVTRSAVGHKSVSAKYPKTRNGQLVA